MTYEEAKLQIQAIPEKIWDQLSEPDREAMEMAFSALGKQIPKKVMITTSTKRYATCGIRITTSTERCATCGRQLFGIGNIHPKRNYCQSCGQAIEWEGE